MVEKKKKKKSTRYLINIISETECKQKINKNKTSATFLNVIFI